MDGADVVLAFSALAQPARLAVMWLLLAREPGGLTENDLAREAALPHTTLSGHLAVLARAGLVEAERQGRLVVYHARLATVRGLVGFLTRDCCDGRPEVCGLPKA